MELISCDERLRELYDLGAGFIFNDFEGDRHTQSSMEFNKLHRASCPECDPRRDRHAMTVKTNGQKLWFGAMQEAAGWLMENRAGNYTKCTRCSPGWWSVIRIPQECGMSRKVIAVTLSVFTAR